MQMLTGQFNDSFKPIMDGVGNVTKNYAYWLNKINIETYVITPNFPQYEDCEEFEVMRYLSVYLPKRNPYRFGMPNIDIAFNKKINQIPFDLVHAHCPFSSGQLALRIAQKRDIPIVATFHSKYYDDFFEIFKSEHVSLFIMKKIVDFFNKVDFVWTVNKATGETLREYGFKGDIEIVYNGTDFIPPDNINTVAKIANERLNLEPHELVFLFVGQLIWQKNLKMLVNSLYLLKNMGVKFKMFFVGQGYAENDLKQLVKQLQLDDCVQFLSIILDRDYLKALFARADLFLFPSVYDNAPIVVREASAMKCPSVVIKDSNAAEGIIDCFNGFLSENNEQMYANKIKDIISNRIILEKVGESAQQTLYKNWEQIVDDVKDRYLDIVKTYNKTKVV